MALNWKKIIDQYSLVIGVGLVGIGIISRHNQKNQEPSSTSHSYVDSMSLPSKNMPTTKTEAPSVIQLSDIKIHIEKAQELENCLHIESVDLERSELWNDLSIRVKMIKPPRFCICSTDHAIIYVEDAGQLKVTEMGLELPDTAGKSARTKIRLFNKDKFKTPLDVAIKCRF